MTYFEAYCNTQGDLQAIIPDINKYDQKFLVSNWVTHATNVYKAYDSGYVDVLFRSGADLGNKQASLGALDTDGEWFYDSSEDVVYIFSSSDVSDLVMEAGTDWDDLKTKTIKETADMIRSYIGKPIMRVNNSNAQGASGRNYPFVIIRANAILACSQLIMPYDPERGREVEGMAMNDEGTGLLDRVKRGEFVLDSDTSPDKNQGVVRQISLDASTTGGIIDVTNVTHPMTRFDDIRVVISTGGTFAAGTSSPVKYDVYVADDTGLKRTKTVENEVVTGVFQSAAYGIAIRFSEGVYVAADEWGISVMGGHTNETGTVKSGQVVR
jgi:hypothetical protein|tara:strand:- start:28288 stop:29262 length:975 start_codon:yes stop_codon:yes gene_type:complete